MRCAEMVRTFLYWCLRELNVPLDILKEYGISALSYSEKEKVVICLQLQARKKPRFNELIFDEQEREKIKRFIEAMVGSNDH
jgi:hypothetical protein